MPEGRVYLCSWEQTGKSFRLWVKSRPKVQGRGGSYDEAEEALLDKICMHFDDGEAVLEFDRPLPVSDRVARFLNPALVTVCGNSGPDEVGPIEQLYSGGICQECRQPIGERTSVPLQVSSLESGYEGGLARATLQFGFVSSRSNSSLS